MRFKCVHHMTSMLACMEQENPSPLLPALSTRCSSNPDGSIQRWETLAMQAEEEDVYLCELAGVSCLEEITTLQAVINTATSTVDHLGPKLTNLDILNLNGSCLTSIRDLGSGFRRLSVLCVARCGLNSLDGIASMPSLRELYCAYNDISDMQPLIDCPLLEVLDLEGNAIADIDALEHLAGCQGLQALTLAGNAIEHQPGLALQLTTTLPSLSTYNDQPITVALAQLQPGANLEHAASSAPSQALLQHSSSQQADVAQDGAGIPGSSDRALIGGSAAGDGELNLVLSGIKYAQVGLDSNEFKETTASMLMSISHPATHPTDSPQTTTSLAAPCSQQLVGSPSISCSGSAWLGPSTSGCVPCEAGGVHHVASRSPASQPSLPAAALPIMPPRPFSASAVVVPVSTSAWLRTLQSSTAGALANLRASREGSLQAQLSSTPPGTADSLGSAGGSPGGSRPPSSGTNTRDSGGSARASTASLGTGHTARPASAMSHTSSRPFSGRPGTGGSGALSGGRPSTASLQAMHSQGGLYWRKHRISATAGSSIMKGGAGGDALMEEVGGQVEGGTGWGGRRRQCVDPGGDAIGGSLARDLRKRRQVTSQPQPVSSAPGSSWKVGAVAGSKAAVPAPGAKAPAPVLLPSGCAVALSTVYDSRQLLEELKQWKLETADRALLGEEGAQEGSQGLWGGCSTVCSEDSQPDGQPVVMGVSADILDLTASQVVDDASRPASSSSNQQQPAGVSLEPRSSLVQPGRVAARRVEGRGEVQGQVEVPKARGTHRTMLSKVIKDVQPKGAVSRSRPSLHSAASSPGGRCSGKGVAVATREGQAGHCPRLLVDRAPWVVTGPVWIMLGNSKNCNLSAGCLRVLMAWLGPLLHAW